ncbi:MAG: DUF11 domain-containing protein, partial [Xanthomonadales bacterium]|nr:DUF11 domain-containing protein [Xanthomonadales bacterium]
MKASSILAAGLALATSASFAQVTKPPLPAEALSRAAFPSSNQAAVPNILDVWGFEPGEGFSPGALNGQQGWTVFGAAPNVPQVSTAAPVTGVQHIQIALDGSVANGTLTGGFSPDRGAQPTTNRSRMSVDVQITDAGGADYDIVPQTPSQMFLAARIKFSFLGDILILDDTGGGLFFEDSGVDWPVNTVFNLRVDMDPVANTLDYFIDDVLIYSSVAGVFAGTNFEQVVILSDNFQLTDVGNFDNLLIDTDFQDNADVALTKTVAAPAAPTVGDTVTYTLAASNAGPGDAMNVVVTDTLPANLTYVSNTCGAAVAGQVVTWTIGVLANGANASCDVVTTINNFGPINNSAAITSDTMDPNAANNSATASLGGVPFPADVGVTLTASTAGGLAVGDTFVYTVTGTNFGPGDATGVLFALTLSNKVSFVSSDCGATVAGNVVSFTAPTLANGATTSCAITVAVVLGGDLQATASVTTATVDPNLV